MILYIIPLPLPFFNETFYKQISRLFDMDIRYPVSKRRPNRHLSFLSFFYTGLSRR
jgi:hypothetical protein